MKILFLTHRVPYPPNRGDRIRSFNLLKFLAARHQVSLACLADEPFNTDTENKLRELTEHLAIVPQSSPGKWLRASLAFASGRTATSGLFASHPLKQIVREWGAAEKFDCVIAYCSSMAPYAFLPELRCAPVLVDLVDVDSQKWLDYSHQAQGFKRVLYRVEGSRLRKLEERITRKSAAITLVSEAEAELFRSVCPNTRTHAIINGVDLEYFRFVNADKAVRPFSCVFVGALDYGANIDAIQWFCTHVWPQLIKINPQATLELVGRCPTPAILKLAELPGVTVAANVPDVRPYLERSAIAIAPLRIARGIQNKVLEAMAMGKAVVASPGATAGLDVQAGVQLVQAETPSEWREALLALWSNSSERSRLGNEARKFVERQHSWESTLEPWESLIRASIHESQEANLKENEPAHFSQVSDTTGRIYENPAADTLKADSRSVRLHPLTGHKQTKQ